MARLYSLLFAISVALATAAPVQAEVLLLDTIQHAPANAPDELKRPTNGQSMTEVERVYGPPQEKSAPVGDPPITRWSYADFTVYFEYNLVIHSVVHHPVSGQ